MAVATIGADVEVFLRNDKQFFNLAGKIGGTKKNPHPTHFGVESWDNVAYEFAIDYTDAMRVFSDRIVAGVTRADEIARRFGCFVAIAPSAIFKPEWLDNKYCQEFGCDPDYSAWTLAENPNPKDKKGIDPGLRSCGGHIHVGAKVDHVQLVRLMDLHLGVPSVLMDPDRNRRALYGKAGAHRKKPYGVEYRALSNFWVTSQAYIDWVFTTTMWCVQLATQPDRWVQREDALNIIKCINMSDQDLASRLIESFGLHYPRVRY